MKMKKFLALAMSVCMIFSMTTAVFAEGDGTEENPIVLDDISTGSVNFNGGGDSNEQMNYSYTVPVDTEGTVMYNFTVTASKYYTMNVTNTSTYAECSMYNYKPSWEMDSVTTGSVKACAGETLAIKITTASNDDDVFEAFTLSWVATSTSVGTESSPEVIETLNEYGSYQTDIETVVIPNTDGYYFSYEAETVGMLLIYINENATVDTYDPEYPDMGEDDPSLVNNIDDLKAEIVLTNTGTSFSKKLSEGTTEYVVETMWGSETYNVIQIPVTTGDVVTIQLSSTATGYDDGVTMVCGLILDEPYGSAGDPVSVIEDDQEITVPAGQCYYVSIDEYSFQSYPLSILGGTATVYDYYGDELEGQTDLLISGTQISMWETVYMFQIENQSEDDITYTIKFTFPEGAEQNPKTLETNDSDTHTFTTDGFGYCYYTWTAEADGIVMFEVYTESEEATWQYTVDSSSGAYVYVYSDDDPLQHIALDVKEGDELTVMTYASQYDDDYNPLEVEATVNVEFVESVGTVVDPEIVSGIAGDRWEGTGIWSGDYDEDGVIELDMGDATVIPAEILNAIADYNADLVDNYGEEPIDFTIVLTMDGYKWELANITTVVPVDLGITFDTENTDEDVIAEVADGDDYITFTIAHSGDFGFDAVLEFEVDAEYAGKTAALYWDNNGTLEAIGECTVAADGTVTFDMTHASDYVLVLEDTAVEEESSSEEETTTAGEEETTTAGENETTAGDGKNPDTGDSAPVLFLLVIAVVASAVVLTKKKVVEE